MGEARKSHPFVLSLSKHERSTKPKPSGVARQLVTFFCFAKKKVTKEKATPVCRPSGSLDISPTSGAAQLALAGHTPRAPLRSSNSARPNLRLLAKYRGGAQGKKIKTQSPKPTRRAACCPPRSKKERAQSAHKTAFPLFPCAPPSSTDWSGDVGEDCLSAQREFRSRLTSRATQGTPKGWRTGGDFFGLPFLARQER